MTDAVMPSGMADIQSRIAAIQTRIAGLSGGGTRVTGATTAVALSGSARPGAFSSSLAAALDDSTINGSGTDSSGGTDVGSTDGAGVTGSGTSASAGTSAASGTSSAGSSTSAGTTSAAGLLAIAKDYLGVPYLWGGTNPSKGLDCSGFTQLVFGRAGISLPRTAAQQAATGTRVSSLAQAQPGDLLFFGSPAHHVGIYVGDGKMINAPHTGAKVRIEKVYEQPSSIRREQPLARSSQSLTSGGLSGSTPYADLFRTEAARSGVPAALLAGVAKVESGFRADAVSSAGAVGLMQLMPATARGLGVDPRDPQQAVHGAAQLLAGYLRSYKGNLDLALAAYNAGPGAVARYGGVPPYGETQQYTQKVQRAMREVAV